MKKRIITIIAICMSIISSELHAQDIKSVCSGITIRAGATYSNWSSNSIFAAALSEQEPNGIGFFLEGSYGFSENLSAFVQFRQTNFERRNEFWSDYNNSSFLIGAKYLFGGTLSMVRPFVQAAIGTNSFKIGPVFFDSGAFAEQFELDMSGIGFDLAAGFNVFVTAQVSINIAISTQFGQFSTITLSNQDYDPGEETDFRFITGLIGAGYNF